MEKRLYRGIKTVEDDAHFLVERILRETILKTTGDIEIIWDQKKQEYLYKCQLKGYPEEQGKVYCHKYRDTAKYLESQKIIKRKGHKPGIGSGDTDEANIKPWAPTYLFFRNKAKSFLRIDKRDGFKENIVLIGEDFIQYSLPNKPALRCVFKLKRGFKNNSQLDILKILYDCWSTGEDFVSSEKIITKLSPIGYREINRDYIKNSVGNLRKTLAESQLSNLVKIDYVRNRGYRLSIQFKNSRNNSQEI